MKRSKSPFQDTRIPSHEKRYLSVSRMNVLAVLLGRFFADLTCICQILGSCNLCYSLWIFWEEVLGCDRSSSRMPALCNHSSTPVKSMFVLHITTTVSPAKGKYILLLHFLTTVPRLSKDETVFVLHFTTIVPFLLKDNRMFVLHNHI